MSDLALSCCPILPIFPCAVAWYLNVLRTMFTQPTSGSLDDRGPSTPLSSAESRTGARMSSPWTTCTSRGTGQCSRPPSEVL
ncbi:hypothetical protein C8Q80DRAFT_339292 [Daedaleopsis nitida]|nr:hypothetical protein C8Q80DRAFT_339292 [Daedaleopsis nitida]